MNDGTCFRTAAAMAAAVLLCFLAGCGEEKTAQELQDLRKEIAQMRGEIRELRTAVTRRFREGDMRRPPMERADRYEGGMTNGVSRMRYTKPRPTREEMEARRKMMQDPEMRKKLEAERKARMEERRRQHEERRHEMEQRRRSGSASDAATSAK